jgi:amino acid transporter
VAVLLMAPAMFVGFDVIPQGIEEMKIPLRLAGKLVVFAIALGALWYILMILGVAFGAPASVRADASVPVADVAAHIFGSPAFGSLIIVAGIGGILTSWNAMYLGATRIIFAMARAKMLPAVFAKLHPKYKTPTAAIFLTGALGILGTLTGKNALGWFVDASSFGVVVGYLCVAISFCILRRREPDLARPFKAVGGFGMGVLAVVAAAAFICLYLPFSPSGGLGRHEWLMVLLWAVIGVVLALIVHGGRRYRVSAAEREFLLYGKEYARREYLEELGDRIS